MAIFLCSLALQGYTATKYSLKRNLDYDERQNIIIYRDICRVDHIDEMLFIYLVVTYFIGLWTPMFIIVLVHIAMFLKLTKQARIRAQSTSSDSRPQMQRISKIFLMTVLAFFTCCLPVSILLCILSVPNIPAAVSNVLVVPYNFCIPLANLNSCLNPFIYSKIHLKILSGMRLVWRGTCNLTDRCISLLRAPSRDEDIQMQSVASPNTHIVLENRRNSAIKRPHDNDTVRNAELEM